MIEVLKKIALKAGQMQAESHSKGRPSDISEKAPHDFVTSVDRACEAYIIGALQEAFPGIPVLAEEGSGSATGAEETFWCIDPLDGTNNFVHGLPMFCVSLGLVKGGRPELGVVYDAVHGELFSGGRGLPAEMNGRPIRTSGKRGASGAFLATGFPYKEFERLELYISGFRQIVRKAGGVRRCGSAAIDICYTACGRFDGFWELGLKPWDMAAGAAILEAAGGSASEPGGGVNFIMNGDIVAGATEELREELRGMIRPPFPS